MKLLSRFVFVFLMVCIAFPALQTAYAQSIQTLSAAADGPIFINVVWTPGSGITPTRYNIYANDAMKMTLLHMPGANQSYSLTVSPSTAYVVKVAAMNSSGVETDYKTAPSVTTPTNVPSGVAASQPGAGQPVRVRWDYIHGMTSYKVYRSSDNGATWVTSYSGPGNFSAGNEVWITFSCPTGSYKFAVTSSSVVTVESNKSTAASFTVQ